MIRNIAIIAHVDHGKTTLVDALLKQSGTFKDHQNVSERAMDSNDLEKERGITILAKCTSIMWKGVRLNIVDTPGHADFGGEVERILSMVDGVLVLVDAAEGPMPQTKFVVTKALKLGLKPIVVINKIDRQDARPDDVVVEVMDLFSILDATKEQLEFPYVYSSSRQGWAVKNLSDEKKDLSCLFDLIIEHIKEPVVNREDDFSMLVSLLDYDPYLGRILTGKVYSGSIKVNESVKGINSNGDIETGRISKILVYRGLERIGIEEAFAGDIIAVSGLVKTTVADTIASPNVTIPIDSIPIDPPILSMTFAVNDSPLAGREGKKLTSRMIGDRLLKEAEVNVAIRVSQTDEAYEVAGRGELQLGVLIENMRREGFELSISRPKVVYKADPVTKEKLEPMEEVHIDVDEDYSGVVMEKMGTRKGEVLDMKSSGGGKTRLTFLVPSRGLIGYQGEFLTDTRGTGIMSRLFHSYMPYKGPLEGRRNGVLISNSDGSIVAYALANLEDRGIMFVSHGTGTYLGMIVGEHNRSNDLDVNPVKGKQLSNVRASGKDEAIKLTPPRVFTLEDAMSYIQDDELVEITPKNIRLRKRFLNPNERKRPNK
jgi:GTP-binding protein